jgi:hypothetical protein
MDNNLPPKKILILAANPLSTVRLNLDREVSEIRTSLQLSANSNRFVIEDRGAVRPDQLHRYMHDFQPQIVHFSGHGGEEVENEPSKSSRLTVIKNDKPKAEGLILENGGGDDDDGDDDDDRDSHTLVSGESLSNLFKKFDEIECVVLNACYSATQAKEIVKHVPYVVAMNREITDVAARKFSVGFYTAIWNDRSIEDAFDLGKNAIELYGLPEELTPRLFTGDRQPAPSRRITPGLKIGLFFGVGMTVTISLARLAGLLQPLELAAYDQTLRSRPSEIPDRNILVIRVEEDTKKLDRPESRNTLSDEDLNKLLGLLSAYGHCLAKG